MNGRETVHLPSQFQFLVDDFGFRIVASDVSPYFDNMSVVLANNCLNVRISRDRGILDAEVSPNFAPETWKPLGLLRQVALRLDSGEIMTIDVQADFLRSGYDTVVAMLLPENLDHTSELIRQVGKARFSSLFPGQVEEQ